MSNFRYEWWTVRVHEPTGWCTWELKGKSRDHVIRQITKCVKEGNSDKNKLRPFYERQPTILEVDWESLTLDRIGYQRLS